MKTPNEIWLIVVTDWGEQATPGPPEVIECAMFNYGDSFKERMVKYHYPGCKVEIIPYQLDIKDVMKKR